MVMGGWISNDAPNQNSHCMMGEGISVVWEVRIENGERGGGERKCTSPNTPGPRKLSMMTTTY